MVYLEKKNEKKEKKIKRGQIWFANLPNQGNSVQYGTRPVLVISNNACNKHSSIITVIPLTSVEKKSSQPTHIYITHKNLKHSVAMCEQIISISKNHLDNIICFIDELTMTNIEQAIKIQTGIIHKNKVEKSSSIKIPQK